MVFRGQCGHSTKHGAGGPLGAHTKTVKPTTDTTNPA